MKSSMTGSGMITVDSCRIIKVGRDEERIGASPAQGGTLLRQAWHTRVPLRGEGQAASYLQRFLGRHHRRTPHKVLVEPLALS